jgi:hypothetical protein
LIDRQTQGTVRRAALHALLTTDWVDAHNVVINDLDTAADNEDDFDACITAAALLRCLLEGTPVAHRESPALSLLFLKA